MFKIDVEIFNFGASMAQPVQARVRAVLKENALLQANVESLADDADLYAAGLTSHATVNLMLALEEAFDIEFPDRLLRRRTFSSVNAIAQSLDEIGVHKEAA
jgi:acyl carrier protein